MAVFSAALELELARRENDEKVRALNVQMIDMMSTLYMYVSLARIVGVLDSSYASLKHIENEQYAAAELLTDYMIKVAKSIRSCAETCESYQKKNLACESCLSRELSSASLLTT